jgi:hypothetical protein
VDDEFKINFTEYDAMTKTDICGIRIVPNSELGTQNLGVPESEN